MPFHYQHCIYDYNMQKLSHLKLMSIMSFVQLSPTSFFFQFLLSKNIPIPLTSKSDAQKCWSLDLEQVFIGSIEYYWHQGFSFFGWDGGTQDMGSHSPLPELSLPVYIFPALH